MSGKRRNEAARIGLLAAVAAWLLHPFATSRMYGAGDALWYANMLADYVLQLRHGIFPIFAGQTEYAFNGAVYPLRVAPFYQHLAGALDLLTGQSLGFITLQHLTVILCGVTGIYASYFTLSRIAPERRWSAAGFAILYLSCPGILGTIYTQDLYMTWMTVPLAPFAVYGIVRTFRKDDLASQVWLAASLASLWWAHAPIALWFTALAAVSQIVRLFHVRNRLAPFKRAALGAVLFILLAQYPFVSVSQIQPPGAKTAVVGTLAHPEQLIGFVRSAFPAVLLPLSDRAGQLSDLQLGYGLWLVFFGSLAAWVGSRHRELPILLASAGLLLILVLPIPGITSFLWNHIPAGIVRITYYWPMQRFYLIVAALLAAAGQIALTTPTPRRARAQVVFAVALFLCCSWSLWESRQFIRAASERTASEARTAMLQRPENILLMDHAYGLFAKVPAYFTNGVVDPRSQVRLFAKDSGKLIPQSPGQIIQSGALIGTVDANPGILDLSPILHISPGLRYELQFDFPKEDIRGILQLVGHSLFREYSLPSSGEAQAFGSGPGNSRSVDLWTSDPSGDDVQIRFIPTLVGAKPSDFASFGLFALFELGSSPEPVSVQSLVPFTADVRIETDTLVETPRVFMVGYRAAVDGHSAPVAESVQGLATISVLPGDHTVSLWFVGPALLRLSYWSAVCAWAAITLIAGIGAFRPKN
jgi:hypothetical protein